MVENNLEAAWRRRGSPALKDSPMFSESRRTGDIARLIWVGPSFFFHQILAHPAKIVALQEAHGSADLEAAAGRQRDEHLGYERVDCRVQGHPHSAAPESKGDMDVM